MADSIKMEKLEVEENSDTPVATVTPKKQKATPKKRAGPATPKTPTSAKKQKFDAIPECPEDLTDADKLIIKMREENKNWAAIDEAWERLTGIKPANTTLRKRYGRLKAAISRVEDKHLPILVSAHDETKAAIEEEKKALDRKLWTRIADAMEGLCGKRYEPGTIEKDHKRVLADASLIAAKGDDTVDSNDTDAVAKYGVKAEHEVENGADEADE